MGQGFSKKALAFSPTAMQEVSPVWR